MCLVWSGLVCAAAVEQHLHRTTSLDYQTTIIYVYRVGPPILLLLIAATAAGCCSAAAAIDHEICQFVVLVEATSNFSTADETSPHSSDRRIPLFILGPLSPICLQRAPILLALPPLPLRRIAGLSCTRHVLD